MRLPLRLAASALLLLLLPAGCGDQQSGPYVGFAGGGFVFDYKTGAVYYGFLVRPLRSLPKGTVLEAQFEDPAGGPSIMDRMTVVEVKPHYGFRTPPLSGVKKDRPYHVEIHVLEAGDGRLLASYGRTFKSDVDQAWFDEPGAGTGTAGATPPG